MRNDERVTQATKQNKTKQKKIHTGSKQNNNEDDDDHHYYNGRCLCVCVCTCLT